MVRILLDPSMYHPHLSVADECRKAADLGYEYLELSPRADFHEWHHYPKVDDAQIAQVKKAMAETGVKIWTFNPVFNWSSPDEQERQAQVRNWRRLLEIAQELEVPLIATELSGDPNQPLRSEHQFYRSIEELIPDFEKRGIACTVEAHPTTSWRRTTGPCRSCAGSTSHGSTTSSAVRTCSTCRRDGVMRGR